MDSGAGFRITRAGQSLGRRETLQSHAYSREKKITTTRKFLCNYKHHMETTALSVFSAVGLCGYLTPGCNLVQAD